MRLAVDEDHVVVVRDFAQHSGEDLLAGHLVDEVHFGGRQVDVGGDDVEVRCRGVLDRLGRILDRADEQVVDIGDIVGGYGESCGEGALRVEVDAQDLAAILGEGRAEVDRGRRLADPALLVAQGDDARGAVSLELRGGREIGLRASGGTQHRGLETCELRGGLIPFAGHGESLTGLG